MLWYIAVLTGKFKGIASLQLWDTVVWEQAGNVQGPMTIPHWNSQKQKPT